jgi:hypothetical protein
MSLGTEGGHCSRLLYLDVRRCYPSGKRTRIRHESEQEQGRLPGLQGRKILSFCMSHYPLQSEEFGHICGRMAAGRALLCARLAPSPFGSIHKWPGLSIVPWSRQALPICSPSASADSPRSFPCHSPDTLDIMLGPSPSPQVGGLVALCQILPIGERLAVPNQRHVYGPAPIKDLNSSKGINSSNY